ncbi:polysaccharide biosynthesis/export family protein [Psychromarinibacter sp. S121]|uniref:polysaccharide biosynthesis/export family protein n=1 Tax=Psychromarinibacter sp. S121 TaxID=3415127 RepID=UPI003C7C2173
MFARSTFHRAAAAVFGLLLLIAGTAATAQGDYRIRSGDTLQIEVIEDPSLNRSVLVLPDGSISFPFVGSVRAGGLGVGDVRNSLAAGLSPNFASQPTVVVSVASVAEATPPAYTGPARTRTIDVYITGEVANAGRVEVKPGTTILQFIAEAGGLTPFAAESRIQLHRTDRKSGTTRVYLFSYSGKGNGTRISPATRLAPGDVVIVPSRRLFE